MQNGSSFVAKAQEIVLKPTESITSWFSLEEWIFSNSGLAFQTKDFGSFQLLRPTFLQSHSSEILTVLDGNLIESSWLNNHFSFFPNLLTAGIDSIIIRLDANHPKAISGNATILEIYTKSVPSIKSEASFINVINDPGLYTNDLGSRNIERVNSPFHLFGTFKTRNSLTKLFFNEDKFSRTNPISYDRQFNNTFSRRTTPPNGISRTHVQRINKRLLGLSSELSLNKFELNSLITINDIPEHYIWENRVGIEVPTALRNYQASFNIKNSNKTGYLGSFLSFSTTASDTLSSTYLARYGMSESKFLLSNQFQVPVFGQAFNFSANTSTYFLKDTLTDESIKFTEYSFRASTTYFTKHQVNLNLGNRELFFKYRYTITPLSTLSTHTSIRKLDNNRYSYQLDLGYPGLTETNHTVAMANEMKESLSQISLSFKNSSSNQSLYLTLFYTHFWNYTFEDIALTPILNSNQLASKITYTNIQNFGSFGLYSVFSKQLTDKLFFKSVFNGYLFLNTEDRIKKYTNRIPAFNISEILQYRADDNFIIELFFKYIPTRKIVEYESLEEQTGFPPSRVRPIPLLNFSTSMWFFDRRLETKLTLRNLLNKAESYDTNGQYYYMSMKVSARINFGL